MTLDIILKTKVKNANNYTFICNGRQDFITQGLLHTVIQLLWFSIIEIC